MKASRRSEYGFAGGLLLTLTPNVRRVLLAVVLLLLLWLAWTGLSGGITQLSQAQTLGQQAQTLSQIAYGLFALLCGITTFWGRRWSGPLEVCWAVSITVAAGLAAIVWGGTSVAIGVLSGGAALLIALVIVWLRRAGARGL